eukprot:scaffold850_cov189-Ochromonas_danica.AAC.5
MIEWNGSLLFGLVVLFIPHHHNNTKHNNNNNIRMDTVYIGHGRVLEFRFAWKSTWKDSTAVADKL